MTLSELLELCSVHKTLTPSKARAVANTLGYKHKLVRIGYSTQIGVIDANLHAGAYPFCANNYSTIHLHHDARGYWLSVQRSPEGAFDNTCNPQTRGCIQCKRLFVKQNHSQDACSLACTRAYVRENTGKDIKRA